ncbi:MAG TPA: endonuclease MutS2 [Candidatus Kryptonia bacterium]|nr:endonuclease MutS2 [Candidatus Kryptonia bacterium]
MRPRDLDALEFDRVRAQLATFAHSTAGQEACQAIAPSNVLDLAATELDRTWQYTRWLDRHGGSPISEFPDIRPALKSAAHSGFVLDAVSLLAIRTVLRVAAHARSVLGKHAGNLAGIADLTAQLQALPGLLQALERALDDHGGVTDEASDELADVRRTLRRLRDQLTRRLEDLVQRPTLADAIAEQYVTLRNNRFVIPVKASHASRMSGVVQDRSVSGETVFVEPLFAVDLNNQLLMAAREEEAIVRRILADLTELARQEHAALAANFAALVALDVLTAKARFAQRYRCTQPLLGADEVRIRGARHPVLLFTGRAVTPVDLFIPRGQASLVITGPNTGGKTVALKAVGLLALMAQSGMLIPAAEESCLPCFTAIFADVGDAQSIERNLSTFSAHIANLTDILAHELGGALVLLDEPGVGTDPDEGAALAIGLVQTLETAGARVVLTTHGTPVKIFALSRDTCITAAVDFDVATLTPRYRLSYHSLGESLALPIAQRLGLPAAVLTAARAAQSEQSKAFGAAVSRLEDSRRAFEERHAEAAARAQALADQQRESERLLGELRERRQQRWRDELAAARTFVRSVKEQGRDLLAALERGAADRRALEQFVAAQEQAIAKEAVQVEESAPNEPTVSSGPPRVGDTVEVGVQGISGQLLEVKGARAWIQRGSMRFEVPAAQLRKSGGAPRHREPPRVTLPAGRDSLPMEITLIGLRAREAIDQLDSFLDESVRAQHASVRIIHGVGSGALRRAVQEYLSASPYCDTFRGGEPPEGGAGVTVATLAT